MALVSLASRLLNEMSHEFDNVVCPKWHNSKWLNIRTPFDIISKPDAYNVQLELPGVKKDNINIDLDDENILRVHAEREMAIDSSASALFTGRSYGTFSSSISLPSDIDTSSLEARLEDGVLMINIKKRIKTKQESKRKFLVQ